MNEIMEKFLDKENLEEHSNIVVSMFSTTGIDNVCLNFFKIKGKC